MGDEVAAALGRAGVHDELTRDVIERTQHRDLLRLSRRGNTQIRPCLGPDAGEIGMRQRLALVTVEQNNVAGLGLLLAQLQTQADPFDLGRRPVVPSACAAAAASGTFFAQGLGQLRAADAHALTRFDLGAQPGDRPVAPVGDRFPQQGQRPHAKPPRSSPAPGPAPRWPSAPRRRRS